MLLSEFLSQSRLSRTSHTASGHVIRLETVIVSNAFPNAIAVFDSVDLDHLMARWMDVGSRSADSWDCYAADTGDLALGRSAASSHTRAYQGN